MGVTVEASGANKAACINLVSYQCIIAEFALTGGKVTGCRQSWAMQCHSAVPSLVPRPPRPAFVACSTKSGGRPGRIYHVMRAVADVMFS